MKYLLSIVADVNLPDDTVLIEDPIHKKRRGIRIGDKLVFCPTFKCFHITKRGWREASKEMQKEVEKYIDDCIVTFHRVIEEEK